MTEAPFEAASSPIRPLAVILAAGLGTRMRSPLAKVLHPLCGQPMLRWVVEAAIEAGCDPLVVVHHQEDAVRDSLGGLDARFVRQESPRGTGDALRSASVAFEPHTRPILVVPGDTPLVPAELLLRLAASHRSTGALCTLVSMVPADPAAYGRVLRDHTGGVERIVEASEASAPILAIGEVNSGVYAFDGCWLLREVLPALRPHPPKDEFYLTDAVATAAVARKLSAIRWPDSSLLVGINDRWALALAEEELQKRILRGHALAGVTLVKPGSLRVEAGVTLGRDAVLEPGVCLLGHTRIGDDVRVGAGSILSDCEVGRGSEIRPYTVASGAVIGEGCMVGPFSRLRQGTRLEHGVHVGNFVETKNAVLDANSKANHLSYLGDVHVGEATNVGAGTITCNYDGFRKSRTEIGRDVFIGSDVSLVAPVSVGDGAIVGAGSVITRNVPAEAVAVARGEQVQRENAATRMRTAFARRAGKGGK
jgi:bifunctional UDP-N-acetylglucosamine pyrophosphorylase / glucosamine-1-phosphate N-acetyltransferase